MDLFHRLSGCVLLILFLTGCNSKKNLSYNAYLDYIKSEESGLSHKTSEGGFTFESVYKPSCLIAYQNLSDPTNQQELDSLSKLIEKYRYFVLTISKENKDLETFFASTSPDFNAKINYLTNVFPATIKYRYKGEVKEHAIYDYLYTRSFGIAKSSFLLVFEIEALEKDIELIIPGNEIGFEQAIIPFSHKNLDQVPYLKL